MAVASYVLPKTLDLASVASVRRDLLDLRGGDLELDASQVEKLGGLGLQLLLAAGSSWERDGSKFQIINRSSVFNDVLRLTGIFLPGKAQ